MFNLNKIIRYIRQNRKTILVIIGIILSVAVLVQVLDRIAKGILENGSKNIENVNTNTNTSSVYQPNKTILSNTTVKEKAAKENNEIIDEFINFCNNGEIENAYELLSDECKKNMYNNMDSFKNNYYDKIFTEKKEYNIQSWITFNDNYTYKVRFNEDILATGRSNSNAIEDYITIVKNNDEVKLNINSYVLRENVNTESTSNDITIKVKFKDIYINKEEYFIDVTNNSDNDIMLDSLNTTTGIKLFGINNVEYQAYTNELGEYDVTVPSGNKKNINIKFSKEYNQQRKTKHLVFTDIVLNRKDFKNNINDDTNKASINIEL